MNKEWNVSLKLTFSFDILNVLYMLLEY